MHARAPSSRSWKRRGLTIPEVAEALGVGKTAVYTLFAEGKLRFFMVGSVRRVTPEAVEQYIEENTSK